MGNEVLSILGVVFVALVFVIVLYLYVLKLRKVAGKAWLDLYGALRKKQDMVPMLIEVVRKIGDGRPRRLSPLKKMVNELVRLRRNAYSDPTDENTAELDFMVKRLLRLEKKNRQMGYDLDFLGLKNDFAENYEQMHRLAVEYNIAASRYNKIVGVFGGKLPLFKL